MVGGSDFFLLFLPTLTHKEANIVSKLENKEVARKCTDLYFKDTQNKDFLTGGNECHIAEFFIILIENKSFFEFFEKSQGRQRALSLKALLVLCQKLYFLFVFSFIATRS